MIFYKNKISGKINFLFTKCVQCGKRVLLKKRYLGLNRFLEVFYYCDNCCIWNRKTKKARKALDWEKYKK